MIDILLLWLLGRLLRRLRFALGKILRVGANDLDLLDWFIISEDRCSGLPLLLLLLFLGSQRALSVKRFWLVSINFFKYGGQLREIDLNFFLGTLVVELVFGLE